VTNQDEAAGLGWGAARHVKRIPLKQGNSGTEAKALLLGNKKKEEGVPGKRRNRKMEWG